MPAALRRDFLEISTENSMLLGQGRHDAGLACRPRQHHGSTATSSRARWTHISPWQNCYLTTQLPGGRTRFVLSTNGHIAAIANPPGNKRATYRDRRRADDAPLRGLGGAATVDPGNRADGLGRVAERELRRDAPRVRAAWQPAAQARRRGYPGSTSSSPDARSGSVAGWRGTRPPTRRPLRLFQEGRDGRRPWITSSCVFGIGPQPGCARWTPG